VELATAAPPDAELLRREEAQTVRRAFHQLTRRARIVIRLRSLKRLPFAEVGRVLGCSAEAARKAYVRALCEFADHLEEADL
jgi:RNA polymerase sigma factor (sigma-70 family)